MWMDEASQDCVRELAGNLDDVLDLVVIPPLMTEGHTNSDVADMDMDGTNTDTITDTDTEGVTMAVVTNSKALRFMNYSDGSYITKQSICSHEDVILAIDSSVDG